MRGGERDPGGVDDSTSKHQLRFPLKPELVFTVLFSYVFNLQFGLVCLNFSHRER